MKFTISVILSSLLAPVAFARPRTVANGEPLAGRSKVTAFVIDDQGQPSVECWELKTLSNSMQVQRTDGSKAVSNAVSVARGQSLEGLDILTWPSYSDVWPPASDDGSVRSADFDLSDTFNLFDVQNGLIILSIDTALSGVGAKDDNSIETHIFSMENGDDWFYFEDASDTSSASRKASSEPSPFTISTISATETELLRIRYKAQPEHTVLHKGACSYTGIETESAQRKSSHTDRGHSGFTVQVNVDDL